MKLKILFFSFLAIAFSFTCPPADKNLVLLSASSQTFCSGIAGRGCNTTYNFTVKVRQPSTRIKIDRLWIGAETVDIKVANLVSKDEKGTFKKNDSLNVSGTLLSNRIVTYNNGQPENEPEREGVKYALPYAYKGQALIGYVVNKKRQYLEIKTIKTLPRVNYP
jgi:hypothetical protein